MQGVVANVSSSNAAAAKQPTALLRARKRSSMTARENWAGWLFVTPFMLLFLVFGLFPILVSIFLSFAHWEARGDTYFVGLANYAEVVAMDGFRKAIWNSFYYAVMVVPLGILMALITAILIFALRSANAKGFWQATFYLPGMVSGIAVAIIWRFFFNYEFGLLNSFLEAFGLEKVMWLGNPRTAMPSLALMALLGGPGSTVIIFVAALGGIPKDLHEAAELDGAGFWRRHLNVTLPLITPSFLYVFVMSTLGALQVFTPVYMLTRGGPVYSTMTVAYFIYNRLMYYHNAGTAAATGLILLVLTVGFTVFQFRAFSRVVEF